MIKLKAYSYDDMIDGDADIDVKYYTKEDADTAIATLQGANDEKAERIVELQKQVDELDGVKKSAEQILQNLLDCGLIKEWYFNGKFNAVLKADDPHLQIAELKIWERCKESEADAAETLALFEERNRQVRELKHSLELASNECCSISERAVKNERRLRRALYKACANWARYEGILFADEHEAEKWSKMIRKCLKKAEEYK